MPIYMNIDGVPGEVTAKGYQNWIEIDSLAFDVERNIRMRVGKTDSPEKTIPTFSKLELTKKVDKASPLLFEKLCKGRGIPEIKIELCYTDQNLSAYSKYVLSEAIISQYSDMSYAEEGVNIEKLKLSFTKIEKTFIPRDSFNKTESPIISGYNLTKAETL